MGASQIPGRIVPPAARVPIQTAAAWAIFILGLLLALPPWCYAARQVIGNGFSLIDGSWQLDLPLRLTRGEWAGRDFVFTYGPLYQLTHALGLIVPPGDLASLLRFHFVLEATLVMACLWGMLWLTGAPLSWRALSYLLWACACPPYVTILFTCNVGLKPMAGLLAVMACGYALTGERAGSWPAALLWGLSAPVLALYASDLGLLVLGALASLGIVTIVCASIGDPNGRSPGRRALWLSGASLLGCAGFLTILYGSAAGRRCISSTWDMISAYSRSQATPAADSYLLIMAGILATALAIATGAVRRMRRELRAGRRVPGRVPALLAAACFSAIWVRYGLTRSDWHHVWPVVAVLLFVVAAYLPCYLRAEGSRLAVPALLGWILVFVASPLAPASTMAASLGDRFTSLAGLELRPARLELTQQGIRDAANVGRVEPGEWLYVWPYETIVGLVAGKSNPSWTVQSYAAHTETLEEQEIGRLESAGEPPVMLFTASWPLDAVDNLSRTPRVIRHLLERYDLASRHDGFLVLRRRAGSPRAWQERELSLPAGAIRLDAQGAMRTDQPIPLKDDSFASDLFLLRIRVRDSWALPGSKPGQIWVTFLLSDGTPRAHKLLVPADDRPHEVLVSACQPAEGLFLAALDRSGCKRSTERVTGLALTWMPIDRLSRRPREIVLDRVAVLRRQGSECVEVPLTEIEGARH